jgi:hypothetical protein
MQLITKVKELLASLGVSYAEDEDGGLEFKTLIGMTYLSNEQGYLDFYGARLRNLSWGMEYLVPIEDPTDEELLFLNMQEDSLTWINHQQVLDKIKGAYNVSIQ